MRFSLLLLALGLSLGGAAIAGPSILGLSDDEPIDPSLIPSPPQPGETPSTEDRLKGFLERLFGR